MTTTFDPSTEMDFLLTEHALGKPLDFDRVIAVVEGLQRELEDVKEQLEERKGFANALEEELKDADNKGREERDELKNQLADTKQTVRQAVQALSKHIKERSYTRENLEGVLSDLEILL